MTGADPANVEVDVRAHAGPGIDLARLGRPALFAGGISLARRIIKQVLAPR
jgi:hypothetical protein